MQCDICTRCARPFADGDYVESKTRPGVCWSCLTYAEMEAETEQAAEWTQAIIDVARPALLADRDLAIVTLPNGRPEVYGRYQLKANTPGRMHRDLLRPYFATVAKVCGFHFNGYVVVRYRDEIVVYTGPNTILARSAA